MQPHSNSSDSAWQASPTENSVPENTYLDHIHQTMDTGNYFICSRLFYLILRKTDALFLQDVINLGSCSRTRGPDRFFLCTTDFLREKGWEAKEQEYHFKSLTKLGYLKTERRGLPARRWVWVDLRKINDDIDTANFRRQNTPKPPKNKSDSQSPAKQGDRLPSKGGDINKDSLTESLSLRNQKGLPDRPKANTGGPKTVKPKPSKPISSLYALPIHTVTPRAATPPRAKPRAKESKVPFVLNQAPSIHDKPSTAKQRVTPLDLDRAERLRRHAKSQSYVVSRSPKRWADAMRILREQGAKDIDTILDFLVRATPAKPVIHDCHDFRLHFNWLSDLAKQGTQPASKNVHVSKEATEITKRLESFGWPAPKEAGRLDEAVQLSLDNLRGFLADCKRVSGAAPHDVAGFAHRVIRGRLCYVEDFVEQWWDSLADWIRKQKTFRGKLTKLAVGLHNEHFLAVGAGLAAEYDGGSTRLWDQLLQEVKRGPV